MTAIKYVKENRYVAVHPSILFLIAMDYVIRKLFSRSRWHSGSYGSVFPCHARRTVFNVLVRNCEDESRILNDFHRITAVDSVDYKYTVNNSALVNGLQPEATPRAKFQKISKFSKNCLRHSPRRSLRANKNLHITLRRLKICIKTPSGQILCNKMLWA
ncbi:hypothetical protein T12_13089 [Trichinella patagoniensis]|uniref:Uncharacterized protein n=1 Tax=Trichinella patagoniensis TaxID=990121 RepID=A0A0V0ZTD3_9BILA|nr:hypothetical protein T12_13089 [Trichinella patagoniensis]